MQISSSHLQSKSYESLALAMSTVSKLFKFRDNITLGMCLRVCVCVLGVAFEWICGVRVCCDHLMHNIVLDELFNMIEVVPKNKYVPIIYIHPHINKHIHYYRTHAKTSFVCFHFRY